jgi:hypothetical protein
VNAENPFAVPVVPPLISSTAGSVPASLTGVGRLALVDQQQVREVVIAGRQPDAVTVARFTQQREQ